MAALEEGWLAALMRDGCGILEAFFLQHVPECAGQRRPGERHYHHRHLQVQSVLGRLADDNYNYPLTTTRNTHC